MVTGLLLFTGAGSAYSRPLQKQVISVRVDGYVTSKPEEVPVEVDWTVRLKGEEYHLFVSKLQVLTGNVAYYDLITALKPYHPALTITGDDEQLDRFATAPRGQKVSVIAYMQFAEGSRYLMVSNVEYVGEPTAADAPSVRAPVH